MKMPPHIYKVFIPVHLLGLAALVSLYWLPLKWLWLSLAGWTFISGLGVAIGYHRLFSHKAFECNRVIEALLLWAGTMGSQGSSIFWVALHVGIHHPFSDTPKDIHSPVNGKWNSFCGWMFKLTPTDVNFKASVRLMRDPLHLFFHKHYEKILWATVLVTALVDWRVALFFWGLPMVYAVHQENMVDLFCHTRNFLGYRNYETKDNSQNVPLLGWFAWGQGWHNNHHARPKDANFGGNHWWEFDPCIPFIWLLRKRGV